MRYFLSLLVLVSLAFGADECGTSDFSATMTTVNQTYTNDATIHTSNASSYDTDTYYINIAEPGTITVTITDLASAGKTGEMKFSVDEAGCPGETTGQTTFSVTVATATDYNFLVFPVYRQDETNWDYNYKFNVDFTPATPPPSGIVNKERDFSIRYGGKGTQIHGDIAATGGAAICQDNGSGTCNWSYGGYLFDLDPLVVKDDTSYTLNSSTAKLPLPTDIDGSQIKWAGLYWQGHIFGLGNAADVTAARTGYDSVVMTDASGVKHTITSSQNDYYGYDGQATDIGTNNGHRFFYQGFADVTDIVKDSYSATSQYFTVGEIKATSTDDNIGIYEDKIGVNVVWGNWAGWSLVVVYEGDPTNYVLKNVTAYDGFKFLIPTFGGNTSSMTIDLPDNSFYTPPSNDVNSKMTIFAAGAEKGIYKDNLELWKDLNNDGIVDASTEWMPVYNSLNPYDGSTYYNQFNDSITYMNTYINTSRIFNPGIDVDTFDTTNLINNAQTTTKIRASMTSNWSSSDQTFVGSIGISVEMYSPNVCFLQSFTDSSGIPISDTNLPDIDDNISVQLIIKNTGMEVGQKVSIFRTFDSTIDYMEESTDYKNIDSNGVPLPQVNGNDAPVDGDLIEYDSTSKEWRMYIGRDANDTAGGDIWPTPADLSTDIIYIDYKTTLRDENPTDIEYSVSYTIPYLSIDADKTETLPKCVDFNNSFYGRPPYVDPDALTVDAVDVYTNSTDYNNGIRYISTKIANKTGYSFTAVYLDENGNNVQFPLTKEYPLSVLFTLADGSCTDKYDFVGDRRSQEVQIAPGAYSSNTNQDKIVEYVDMPDFARKDMRVRVSAIDWDARFVNTNLTCNQSNTTGSLCGVIACLSSATQAKDAFPTDSDTTDNARVLKDCFGLAVAADGTVSGSTIPATSPCNTQNYNGSCGGVKDDATILPAEYKDDYGCLACILGIANDVCSKDNFAIRPDHFEITSPNNSFPDLLRAGLDYSMNINAISYPVPTTTTTLDYNQTGTNLTINEPTRWFNSPRTEANSTQMPGTASWASQDFNLTNGTITSGTANYTYSNVGFITLNLEDQNWAAVDISNPNDPTPADCSASGAYICADTNVTFIPDHFDVSATLKNRAGGNTFTYLSSDLNMSAGYAVSIIAKNAVGGTTTNFKDGAQYYENPISVEVTVPNVGGAAAIIHNIAATTSLNFTDGSGNVNFNDANDSLQLSFNYPRTTNTPINPFRIDGNQTTVDVNSTYITTMGASEGTANIDGTDLADANVTFVYGRAHMARTRAMCSGSPCTGSVTFYYEFYGDKDANTTLITDLLSPNVPKRSVDSVNWYQNTQHVTSTDGNVTSILSTPSGISGSVFTQYTTNTGVALPYDGTKGFPYKVTIDLASPGNTQSWLIYDKYNTTAPRDSGQLEYYGPGSWTSTTDGAEATVKDTGTTNRNQNTNRRIRW